MFFYCTAFKVMISARSPLEWGYPDERYGGIFGLQSSASPVVIDAVEWSDGLVHAITRFLFAGFGHKLQRDMLEPEARYVPPSVAVSSNGLPGFHTADLKHE
jgi:hypothetical protein